MVEQQEIQELKNKIKELTTEVEQLKKELKQHCKTGDYCPHTN
jgi:uncharacterized coiled-coil DUF342 family protein